MWGVIAAHPKDFETLRETLRSLRRHVADLQEIVVISPTSPEPATLAAASGPGKGRAAGSYQRVFGPALWFDEARFPFSLADFAGLRPSAGWHLQQLLKLYAPRVLSEAQPPILPSAAAAADAFFLVVDADTVWLQDVAFVEYPPGDGRGDDAPGGGGPPATARALLSTYGAVDLPTWHCRSAADLHRYDDFVEALVPGLRKRKPCFETAVVHHTVLQRCVVDHLFLAACQGAAARQGNDLLPPGPKDARRASAQQTHAWQRIRDLARGTSAVAPPPPPQSPQSPVFLQPVNQALGAASPVGHGVPQAQAMGDGSGATQPACKGAMAVSEYEAYFAFAWAFHRGRIRNRPLPFAVAVDWRDWVTCGAGGAPGPRLEPTATGRPPPAHATAAAAAAAGGGGGRCGVCFVVSHSHLRSGGPGPGEDRSAWLARREGVFNARFAVTAFASDREDPSCEIRRRDPKGCCSAAEGRSGSSRRLLVGTRQQEGSPRAADTAAAAVESQSANPNNGGGQISNGRPGLGPDRRQQLAMIFEKNGVFDLLS